MNNIMMQMVAREDLIVEIVRLKKVNSKFRKTIKLQKEKLDRSKKFFEQLILISHKIQHQMVKIKPLTIDALVNIMKSE